MNAVIVKILARIGLLRNITSDRLDGFVKRHATEGKTLDIECGNGG